MSLLTAPLVVVMGVSGAGKSTVGPLLARQLKAEFLEGEHLHPERNQERLASGIALTDNDRRDWYREIAHQLADAYAGAHGLVVACPALRRQDRDLLRTGAAHLAFVHLQAGADLVATRLAHRRPLPEPPLIAQLRMLEPPLDDERAAIFEAALAPADIVARATAWIHQLNIDTTRRK